MAKKKTNSEKKKNKTVYVVLLVVFILMFIVCTTILVVSINNSHSRYTITNSHCEESVEYVRHDIILSPSFSKYGERSVMYDIFDNFSYAIIGIEIDDDAVLDRFCNEMVYKYKLKLKVYNNSDVYSTDYNSFVNDYVECHYNEISMVRQDLFINSTIIHVNEYEILPERIRIDFRIPIVDYEDYRQTRTMNPSDLLVKIDNESKTVWILNRNSYFKVAVITGDERNYTSCETKEVDEIIENEVTYGVKELTRTFYLKNYSYDIVLKSENNNTYLGISDNNKFYDYGYCIEQNDSFAEITIYEGLPGWKSCSIAKWNITSYEIINNEYRIRSRTELTKEWLEENCEVLIDKFECEKWGIKINGIQKCKKEIQRFKCGEYYVTSK